MDRKHRRRFAKVIRELGVTVPTPFDPWEFGANVAELRRRPIRTLRLDTSGARGCGLWLATPEADYIVVDRQATPVLAGHIFLHEIGHIVLGHSGQITLDATSLGFELLDPDVVHRVLARTSPYQSSEEFDAEAFASHLKAFAGRWAPVPRPGTSDRTDAAVIDRMSSAFAGDRSWPR